MCVICNKTHRRVQKDTFVLRLNLLQIVPCYSFGDVDCRGVLSAAITVIVTTITSTVTLIMMKKAIMLMTMDSGSMKGEFLISWKGHE